MKLEGHTSGKVLKGSLARPAQEKYRDVSHPIIKEIWIREKISTPFSGKNIKKKKDDTHG